jgi:hypothetical protein
MKEKKNTHSHLNAPVIMTYNTTPIFKNVNKLFTDDDSFAPNANAPEMSENLEKYYLEMKLISKNLLYKSWATMSDFINKAMT